MICSMQTTHSSNLENDSMNTSETQHGSLFWKTLWNLVFCLCIPFACATAGVGAFIGHFIPDHLCHQSYDTSNERLASCLFGDTHPELTHNTRSWTVAIWSIINFTWCLIPLLMISITHLNKIGKKWTIGSLIIASLSIFLTTSWVYLIDKPLSHFGIIISITILVGGVAMGWSFEAFHENMTRLARVPWALVWPITYFVIYLDMFALHKMVSIESSVNVLFLYRFLVHEVLWWMVEMMMRHAIRLSGMSASLVETIPLLVPKIYRGVFGWFGVLHLRHTFGYVHCVTALISFYQVTSTTTNQTKDLWLLKVLYGKKASETMVASTEEMQLKIADGVAEYIAQISALMSIGGLLLVASVTPLTLTQFRGPPLGVSLFSSMICLSFEHIIRVIIIRDFHQVQVTSWLSKLRWNRPLIAAFVLTLFLTVDACLRTISALCIAPNQDLITCTKHALF